MYLLIGKNLTKGQARWLNNNALQVGMLAWVYNAEVPETFSITLSEKQLAQMGPAIESAAHEFIQMVEDRIMGKGLTGRSHSLAKNKLKLIADVAVSFSTMAHAMDLLSIMDGSEQVHSKEPETVVNSHTSLGIDNDSVRIYLLGLAKGKTIH